LAARADVAALAGGSLYVRRPACWVLRAAPGTWHSTTFPSRFPGA